MDAVALQRTAEAVQAMIQRAQADWELIPDWGPGTAIKLDLGSAISEFQTAVQLLAEAQPGLLNEAAQHLVQGGQSYLNLKDPLTVLQKSYQFGGCPSGPNP